MKIKKLMIKPIFLMVLLTLVPPGILSAELSKSSPSEEEIWRLNSGALNFDFTDPQGNWWVQDEPYISVYRWGFENGNASMIHNPISGSDLQVVFQSNRFGGINTTYYIEVPKGLYEVKLHFAETFWDADDMRVFDVALEGVTVLTNHDIHKEVGKNHADTHTFYPTVNDGVLNITFPRIAADSALISGIEVKVVNLKDDDFLDFIQKKMFWYFWNETNPNTGLIKDRESNWKIGFGVDASVAATGFGLSVLTIGASRGWITEQEASDRILTTLQTLETDPNVQNVRGFWHHFLEIDSGKRSGTSELSNVDSAILIMGALQAGEYFRSTVPNIATTSERLYRKMEWDWWLNRGPSEQHQFMNQGWKPENDSTEGYTISGGGGYFKADWWNRYSETVFMDLLAAASPTFPISKEAWNNMDRPREEMHELSFIHEPPLFTHQYQHLYFDLSDKHDGIMNYFDNGIYSTLNNRETCIRDSLGRFESKRWGLTASDGPAGYEAFGALPEGGTNGTVALTAAGTSMIFTPKISIEALRYMFFQYKHHLWGRYGFADSFNVSMDYRARDVLGIDQGPLIIGIENHRTGMVQDTFMQSPYVQTALDMIGFKPYTDSALFQALTIQDGQDRVSAGPQNAFDGNFSTRWSSEFSDPQWLSIDYGSKKMINKVVIDWEAAFASSYKIQVSDDGVSWRDVFSTVGGGDGNQDVITFEAVQTRFLRLLGTARGSPSGYSIWEMTVSYDTSQKDEPKVKSKNVIAVSGTRLP